MFELILTNPFLAAVLALLALGLVFGAVLGFGAITFKVEGDPIVDQINAILPQTQCGQCGYPGCKPYAEAIASGDLINKCPPGGEAGIHALADLLDVEVIALDDEHGMEDIRKSSLHTRRRVHWLHQVHSSLPSRRHTGRSQTHAYRYCQ